MKRSFILIIVSTCIAYGLALSAQTTQATPNNSQNKEQSMTGCLQKGSDAGTFKLTNVDGSGSKTVDITDSTANLAPHIGHKVEITGTASPGTDSQGQAMKVTAVKMVAASCP